MNKKSLVKVILGLIGIFVLLKILLGIILSIKFGAGLATGLVIAYLIMRKEDDNGND